MNKEYIYGPPAALKRMLNLNVPQTKAAVPAEPVWKVVTSAL